MEPGVSPIILLPNMVGVEPAGTAPLLSVTASNVYKNP